MKVKISTAILIGLAFFLILVITGGFLYIRSLAVPDYPTLTENDSFREFSGETTEIPLSESISRINLDGAWDCTILQGEPGVIKITLPEGMSPSSVKWNSHSPLLSLQNKGERDSGWEAVKVQITLPTLSYLSNQGIADLLIEDFKCPTLKIQSSGLINLRGEENVIDELSINLSGAGSIDFSDSLSTNADINLSGAGSIILNMDGGTLDGSLSGLGNIEYYGTVSRNKIHNSGLGQIKKK